ncbi:hypothetical protein HQ576_08325, partial [bacterium]|nr:hypothetical protein [bacterium]
MRAKGTTLATALAALAGALALCGCGRAGQAADSSPRIRHSSLLLVGVAVATLLASACSGWAAQIHVGSSETSITPDRPVALEGAFRLRISKGVDSPIMASVVVLESREGDKVLERSIMVSADLVHLPMELLQMVREATAKQIPGLDANKIFISVTHTHTAPVVQIGNFTVPEGVMTIEEYCEFFAHRVSQAIVQAFKSLRPASVAWGLGYAQVAYNRRATYLDGRSQMYGPTRRPDHKGPEGPEYNGIPALFFFDKAGKPLAVAANVWCPSQEVEGKLKISADFWHPVRARLKKKFGPEMVVLAWCGPAGDQLPHRRMQEGAEDRMRGLRGMGSWVDEFGRRIADSVIETYELVKEDRHSDARLIHQVETIRLPGWRMSEKEIARIRATKDEMAEDLRRHPEKAAKLSRPISWRAQTIERHEQLTKSPDGCYPTEIHVLRIGDVAVCTNQFELFTQYG